MVHGTEYTYRKYKCRCESCKKTHKERNRNYWENKSKLDVSPSEYTKTITLKINTHGYLYFSDFEHPICNSSGRVLYHRHLMSIFEGRWLTDTEKVHHIDHVKTNNVKDNLKVLTASEHAKTHELEKGHVLKVIKNCEECLSEFQQTTKTQKFCSLTCNGVSQRKIERPDKDKLNNLVWTIPTVKVAEQLGVSDKTIEKWCKHYEIKKPPRGYWAKRFSS